VIVAQLAEHRVVVPKVAGSSPVGHPFEEPREGRQENENAEPPPLYRGPITAIRTAILRERWALCPYG
jgi:hypothetical protein